MKRQFLFGTMLSVALAVGVSAQAPQSQPQPQPQPPAGQSQPQTERSPAQSGQTFTGCVEEASGSSAPAGASGGFVLTNITPGGSSASGSTAGSAAGSTAGTTGSARPSSYRLTGGEDLKQYELASESNQWNGLEPVKRRSLDVTLDASERERERLGHANIASDLGEGSHGWLLFEVAQYTAVDGPASLRAGPSTSIHVLLQRLSRLPVPVVWPLISASICIDKSVSRCACSSLMSRCF